MPSIRVALVGVGNCASNFVQGLSYYKTNRDGIGLMHDTIGGYSVSDIKPVVAFDVDTRKVGRDLGEAIWAQPNCTPKFSDVPHLDAPVVMGPPMDGAPEHLQKYVEVDKGDPMDIATVLKEHGVGVMIIVLPTASVQAAMAYADAALASGAGIVNGIPIPIARDTDFAAKAQERGVPIVGDDFKSQVGGTILHRALLAMCRNRGVRIKRTYQLNYGGNTDFANLVARGSSKHESKIRAVRGVVPETIPVSVNVSHLDILDDTKICQVFIDAENFGGAPMRINATLEVIDSANSSGVLVDAVRCCKLAMDREIGGQLISASAAFMKSPPEQPPDDNSASIALDEFIRGERKR